MADVQRTAGSEADSSGGGLDAALLRLAQSLEPGSKAKQRIEVRSLTYVSSLIGIEHGSAEISAGAYRGNLAHPVAAVRHLVRTRVPIRWKALQIVTSSSLPQVVEELLGYLQAARMLAAGAAGRQPPVAQMAALGADDAAADTDAPEAMELDGALCGAQPHYLARPSLKRSRGTSVARQQRRAG